MNTKNELVVGLKVIYVLCWVGFACLTFWLLDGALKPLAVCAAAWVLSYLRSTVHVTEIREDVLTLVDSSGAMLATSKVVIANLQQQLIEARQP